MKALCAVCLERDSGWVTDHPKSQLFYKRHPIERFIVAASTAG